ncbi:hypothetical protein MMC17_006868 [Xylographa soralifera]|nr:hypothetical protein [Xylographa soralifera]MCJ1383754.1 hypothetical protein [Xylographa soralifera]
MTSTSAQWFIPDDKYKLSNQDYVFCKARAREIKNAVERFDDIKFPVPYENEDAFSQALALEATFFHRDRAGGTLIFADAHEEDEKRWQEVMEDRAKEPLLDEPTEHVRNTKQEFIDHIRECSEGKAESEGGPPDNILRQMVLYRVQHGAVDPEFVDYLLEERKSDYQKSLLIDLSGQGLLQKPRPVMLLIGALINPWVSTPQRKTGIAMGYDFATDKLIIKSFSFDTDQHPFAQSWFAKESENGFYLSQTPEKFAASEPSVGEETSNPKQSNDILMAKYLVSIWVDYHADTLELPEEVVQNLLDSMDIIKRDLTGMLLPEEETKPSKPDIVYEFAAMRRELQHEENNLRSLAAEAKEEGHTVAAENMAKFFEMSVKALKEMTENPDAPLKM